MLQIIGIGRLGRDPELRHTASGKAVCSPSVAFDEGFGDNRKTVWCKVECWNGTAEAVCQHLTKGSLVYVQGRFEMEEWTDRDGNARTTPKIVAQRIEFLGGEPRNGASQAGERREPSQSGPPVPDSDHPF